MKFLLFFTNVRSVIPVFQNLLLLLKFTNNVGLYVGLLSSSFHIMFYTIKLILYIKLIVDL